MNASQISRVKLDATDRNEELVLVEYPGLVKNDDRMLETLGGITKVSQVFSKESKRLELRFHPKNVFNKPAHGDAQPTVGLLLRVRVRRPKVHVKQEEETKPVTTSLTHHVKIMGHCTTAYKFDSLCDFQYQPIAVDPQTRVPRNIYDEIIPRGVTDTSYFTKPYDDLFCPPYVFARGDSVYTKLYREDEKEDDTNEVLAVTHAKFYETKDLVTFNLSDPFPMKPNPQVFKKMTVKYVSDEQLQLVRQLFEKCPIWNKVGLLHETKLPYDKLKHILPSTAYYFVTGPWRTMYVRFGYDPRKDFSSRNYQAFDFRLKFGSGITEYMKIKKICKQQSESSKTDPIIQPIDYPYFEEGKLPRARQCVFRYCDIQLAKIQDMLEKIPTPLTGATCNERSGWLPQGFNETCRQIVANTVKATIRDYYQRNQEMKDEEYDDADDITDDEEPQGDDDEDLQGDDDEDLQGNDDEEDDSGMKEALDMLMPESMDVDSQ